MKYSIQAEGLDEVGKMLNELGDSAKFVASFSLYEGAKVLADAVTQEAKTIQTEPFHYAAVNGVTFRLPSPEEKEIITNNGAMGIAHFKEYGNGVDTSIGYNGSGYAPVNWNHMSSKARTNYKAQSFKGLENMTTRTLKAAGVYRRGVQNMKPIGVIANAINSGTSFMKKQPFFRRAVSRSTADAVNAIVNMAEKLFSEIISKNEAGGKSA